LFEQDKIVKKLFSPLVVVVLSIAFFGVWYSYFSPENKNLRVTYLDVGQGDSTLIQFPDGKVALIDGGPDKKVLEDLGRKLPFYKRGIDVVFLSHPHADHMVGLIYVLQRYKVGRVVVTEGIHETPEYREFIDIVKNKNIPMTLAREGVAFDFSGGVKMNTLYPHTGISSDNPNDLSEVLLLTFRNNEFLFTGDLEKDATESMLSRSKKLRVDVVKVPHHGSKDAYDENLYAMLKPEVAVISVGENKYGHPSPMTLSFFEKIGIKYFRTDKEGDISLFSDGNNVIRVE